MQRNLSRRHSALRGGTHALRFVPRRRGRGCCWCSPSLLLPLGACGSWMVIGANSLGTEATRACSRKQAEAFQYYIFRIFRVDVAGLGSEGMHGVGYTGCVDAFIYLLGHRLVSRVYHQFWLANGHQIIIFGEILEHNTRSITKHEKGSRARTCKSPRFVNLFIQGWHPTFLTRVFHRRHAVPAMHVSARPRSHPQS